MPCFCLSFDVFFYSEIPKNRLPDDVKMRTRHVFLQKRQLNILYGFFIGSTFAGNQTHAGILLFGDYHAPDRTVLRSHACKRN